MNTTGSTKIMWTIIIALCIANIGMAFVVWGPGSPFHERHDGPMMHDGPPPSARGPHSDPFSFLSSMVRMDHAQIEQYAALRDEHRSLVRDLRERLRTARQSMFDHVPVDDPSTLSQDLTGVAAIQRNIDSVTITHFRKVRAILRSDQKGRFDAVIGEMARIMNAPPPPKGGAPDDGPPDHPHDGPPHH